MKMNEMTNVQSSIKLSFFQKKRKEKRKRKTIKKSFFLFYMFIN